MPTEFPTGMKCANVMWFADFTNAIEGTDDDDEFPDGPDIANEFVTTQIDQPETNQQGYEVQS